VTSVIRYQAEALASVTRTFDDTAMRDAGHALAGLAGAVAGSAMGAFGGPPGALAGAVMGGFVGAVAALVAGRDAARRAASDRLLDAELGVTGDYRREAIRAPPSARLDLNLAPRAGALPLEHHGPHGVPSAPRPRAEAPPEHDCQGASGLGSCCSCLEATASRRATAACPFSVWLRSA